MEIDKLKRDLRARVGKFVTTECRRYHPELQKVLAGIRSGNYPAFLCGGAVREFLLSNHTLPRDLDIILGNIPNNELPALFSCNIRGRTGLGGLRLQVKDWSVDLWGLQDTWAFKEGKVAGTGFSDYPKTTFLDIDAVAVELFSTRRQKRNIYSQGFFEAIASKTIDLNFEENPEPAKCIVRALHIADRFGFAVGSKLARFMVSYVRHVDVQELADTYQRRYSTAHVTADKLYNCMKSIEVQLRTSAKASVKVTIRRDNNCFDQQPTRVNIGCTLFATT